MLRFGDKTKYFFYLLQSLFDCKTEKNNLKIFYSDENRYKHTVSISNRASQTLHFRVKVMRKTNAIWPPLGDTLKKKAQREMKPFWSVFSHQSACYLQSSRRILHPPKIRRRGKISCPRVRMF